MNLTKILQVIFEESENFMKLFTDEHGMSFYASEEKVKNLKAIDISSIKDFVSRHGLDPLVLLNAAILQKDKHHELVVHTMSEVREKLERYSDFEEGSLTIDFIKDLSLKEIFIEVVKYLPVSSNITDFDEDFLVSLLENLDGFSYKEVEDGDIQVFHINFPDSDKCLVMKVPFVYDSHIDSIQYEDI